ncbi:hypothetical protein [Psychroserpens sp. SPM9]|uniref:WapI family immunity protein n=1 Tax=Psychroserpens sp. SPM9 TaxID=2975598 RepID=UPI0021A63963|nr:hypothetical protein [Psychroserpens sp. SPM9]MDG5493228.1 hypothetical protein [Psychroserpens sp. SPM9]
MEKIEIKGNNGIIIILIEGVYGYPNETCFKGGYECKLAIEIEIGSYYVKSGFHSSTGELFKFYNKLKNCHTELNGIAEFDSYESNLELTVKYEFGKVGIWGKYQEILANDNKLEFDFHSDQSYLKKSLDQMELIFNKYGGMNGVNK